MDSISDLQGLCDRWKWPQPEYLVHRIGDGYHCEVMVDDLEYSTPLEWETAELAKNAAAKIAYLQIRSASGHRGILAARKMPGGWGSGEFLYRSTRVSTSFVITSRNSSTSTNTFYSGKSNGSTSANTFYSASRGGCASASTFYSTRTRWSRSIREDPTESPVPSKWQQHLHGVKLLPISPFDETNWSGRGQHAEFDSSEQSEIDALLQFRGILGHSATALVEKVQCKRILLARKRIKCNWRLKREDLIKEVEHLQRLKHSHIVRAVGTYVIANELSILLYPATEYNLEDLLGSLAESENPKSQSFLSHDLFRAFACLINTIDFIHGQLIKHMDIKPSNILVKANRNITGTRYHIYLADFGISRSYENPEDAETDSRTACTRTYAAPEVIRQETRGFSAVLSSKYTGFTPSNSCLDIFSLGCVFLEMISVICSPMQRIQLLVTRRLNPDNDWSYQANMDRIFSADLFRHFFHPEIPEVAKMMTSLDPQHRPSASEIRKILRAPTHCCYEGSVPFEAAEQ
ncbi:kinase-like domain-containing protein [Clohesyomyces aquaticus]|uniref:Kinase-like domain-containing protein n=1 Tax=Clohesyomyces aquaticus TaxID=1231657 RepID=A0A1Y1ZYD2_9PLEO|nr:kinase-like domain-containing protein [Clohesyomyces aquaticus]